MARLFTHLLVVTTLVVIGLTACAPQNADVEPQRAPTQAGSLQIYQSPVPSSTPPLPTPAPTRTPPPTATPHLYLIQKGDTMGSIALEFGVTSDELINANPETSPSAMIVGEELLIPDVKRASTSPTISPLALEISPPDCYATLSGGMWCFVAVKNNQDEAVESVSAEIDLFDENGEIFAEKRAFSLIDRLPAGETMPLLAFFANTPINRNASVTLLTAFPSPQDETRYLPASLRNVLTEIAWDGMSAEVNGEVMLAGDASVSRLWVVAIAYDANGQIVGTRRWESVSGGQMFRLTVASLGSTIDRIQLIVEAKP